MAETTSSPSALDPDFLLFALPLAAFLDVFGFASIFFSFGIAGFIVSFILGIPLVVWIVKRGENMETAEEDTQRIAKSETTAQVRQKAGRRAQRWITKGKVKKLMSRALRKMGSKMFTKMLTKLIIGSILVFFPYWLWSTISVLRKK
ncbi:MAG: hypothetical protein ABH841_02730 [Candidatus Nealsonbacteria bacterium]